MSTASTAIVQCREVRKGVKGGRFCVLYTSTANQFKAFDIPHTDHCQPGKYYHIVYTGSLGREDMVVSFVTEAVSV